MVTIERFEAEHFMPIEGHDTFEYAKTADGKYIIRVKNTGAVWFASDAEHEYEALYACAGRYYPFPVYVLTNAYGNNFVDGRERVLAYYRKETAELEKEQLCTWLTEQGMIGWNKSIFIKSMDLGILGDKVHLLMDVYGKEKNDAEKT